MSSTYSLMYNTPIGTDKKNFLCQTQVCDTPAECEDELLWFVLDHWINRTLYLDTVRAYLLDVNPDVVWALEKTYRNLFAVPRQFAPPGHDGKTVPMMWDVTQFDFTMAFHIKKQVLNTILASDDNKKKFYEEIRKSAFPVLCFKPNSIL